MSEGKVWEQSPKQGRSKLRDSHSLALLSPELTAVSAFLKTLALRSICKEKRGARILDLRCRKGAHSQTIPALTSVR